jgi:hypothetical protein
MIILYPPRTGEAPDVMKLSNGSALFPSKEWSGAVRAITEAEATELERLGWLRQADKADTGDLKKAVTADAIRAGFKPVHVENIGVGPGDLLLRAAESEFRRATGAKPARQRIELGELDAGSFGRVRVIHDIGNGEISIAGVHADLDDIDSDLRDAFVTASSNFVNSLEDVAMQAPARATIGALVSAIFSRHGYIADAVRRQKFRARFSA